MNWQCERKDNKKTQTQILPSEIIADNEKNKKYLLTENQIKNIIQRESIIILNRLGYNLNEIAKEMDCHVATVDRWKSQSIDVDNLIDIKI